MKGGPASWQKGEDFKIFQGNYLHVYHLDFQPLQPPKISQNPHLLIYSPNIHNKIHKNPHDLLISPRFTAPTNPFAKKRLVGVGLED